MLNTSSNKNSTQNIAVIGLSCRFPGSTNYSEYWENLVARRSSIQEILKERWDWKPIYGESGIGKNKTLSRHAGFIKDIDKFDANFFNISRREAELMDPQQRILLEQAWSCIEDAGYGPLHFETNTGVFIGACHNDYKELQERYGCHKEGYSATGSGFTIIPNRLSYFFNFHGPSEIIDTACSSSLYAIAHAVSSIRHGECKAALAGGINYLGTETRHLALSGLGVLSTQGECKTFDSNADGYVRAEGVGLILLKGLQQAIEDGDTIYGVIRGIGLNHGGTARTLTSPNTFSQAQVILHAQKDAGISASTITMIEAHGTGTPLGDPMEIVGLKRAFSKNGNVKKNVCGITTVKTNIGHLEGSAGIAGVIKVLLSLKNKKKIPLQNFKTLNPKINLKDSPFYLIQDIENWDRLTDDNHNEIPRRAGVSSFGFGGSNAHIIIEEYSPHFQLTLNKNVMESNPAHIVLSAKNKDCLKDYASNLLKYLEKNTVNLADMAYTLQVGREAMEERLGILATSQEDLIQKLQKFDSGNLCEGLHIGQLKKSNKDSDDAVERSKQPNNFLEDWVKGLSVDWTVLYKEGSLPKRIALPTYPFAKDRYWIEPSNEYLGATQILHPLVHTNTSTLNEQRFTSVFTGEEFFLKDHQVNGQKTLPGVAYLEMAREAIMRALDRSNNPIELKTIVWTTPIVVEDCPKPIYIGLFPESKKITYEIYTESQDGERIIHGRGIAILKENVNVEGSDIHIPKLQASLNKVSFTADDCYDVFKKMGLNYGPAHRGIDQIYIGQNAVLTKLILPSCVNETFDQFVLHPSLMDSALQGAIGFILNSKKDTKLSLPFALESLEILGTSTDIMWAYIRRSLDSTDRVEKLDIELSNESGKVCVRMKGFSSRVLELTEHHNSEITLIPTWKAQAIEIKNPITKMSDVILWDTKIPFEENAVSIFERVKAVMESKPKDNYLFQVVIQDPSQFGISSLFKTAHLENSKIRGQVLLISQNTENHEAILIENQTSNDVEIWYKENVRTVRVLEEVSFTSQATYIPYKDNGIYLISGGAGGLGLIFAQDIIAKTKNARVILTGRSSFEIHEKRLTYLQCDITKIDEVKTLIGKIQTEYGRLTGIIHAAGIVRDNVIINKTSDEFRSVLLPKITGTKNLDEATLGFELDFFILFSSVASVLGNIGQADYAIGNAYMDIFAETRSQKRAGRSLSINWPLWQDGGLQIDAANVDMMKTTTGLVAISTDEGLVFFSKTVASSYNQVIMMNGNQSKIRQNHLENSIKSTPAFIKNIPSDSQDLIRHIHPMLITMASVLLKIRPEDLDLDSELSEYGFDSILLTSFANQLNEKYELELTPPIFFEYSTIGKFGEYLVKNHAEKLSLSFVLNPQPGNVPPPSNKTEDTPYQSRFIEHPLLQHSYPNDRESSIAIIGLSCQFPMAETAEEFWKNLIEEKNCISTIPEQRWDWKAVWGNPVTEENKTNIKWGGFIEGTEHFDPLFFGISPREAQCMDPQQRLLMQHVWLALEDAGYSAESISGTNTGIFVGTGASGYSHLINKESIPIEGYSSTGMVPSIGPNRMSYFLNIHGPSEPIETACSSSLIAIHHAVKAIRNNDCDQALVGGVNTLVSLDIHTSFSKAGMLSEDGKCKTFSKDANGYVRGEGVGIFLLKRLKDAERDSDHIYAVIRGSSENHGGKANSLTAPNPKAQADLIKQAYINAKIDPRSVTYIEAHGTGTALGDPIEINGLKTAFRDLYDIGGYSPCEHSHCGLGSVKTNIGHLELASGIAGVIKVVMQMKHKTLVKSLYSEELNPFIDLKGSPFYVVQNTQPWEALKDNKGEALPRRAGISSFGFGGSNAHVIIEEYLSPHQSTLADDISESNPVYIVLSAKNKLCLKNYAKKLQNYLENNIVNLADMAYTLQIGRDAMEERLGIVTTSKKDLIQKLQTFDSGDLCKGLYVGQTKGNKELLSDFETQLERWISQKQFEKILKFWVKGLKVNWMNLCGETKPKRISLPTYPFEKERYWIDTIRSKTTIKPKNTNPVVPSDPTILLNQTLQEMLSKELHMKPEEIDKKTPFSDLGLDSITSVTFVQNINKKYNLSFDSATVYNFPTIEKLSNYILKENEKTKISFKTNALKPSSIESSQNSPIRIQLSSLSQTNLNIFSTKNPKTSITLINLKNEFLPSKKMVSVCDFGDGILELQINYDNFDFEKLQENIDASFLTIIENLNSKVVLVTLNGQTIPQIQNFTPLNITCELPVISVLNPGQEIFEQWLAQCDTIIYDDASKTTILRLGTEIASAPRQSLLLLKKHMSQNIIKNVIYNDSIWRTLHLQNGIEAINLSIPTLIPLKSDVVEAKSYENGVICITMCDRENKNMFTPALISGVIEVFDHIKRTPHYKVVVLTGYNQYFACGGTKEELLAIQEGHIKFTDSTIHTIALFCNIPVISAIQGHAIGAGWVLGLYSDVVLMSEENTYLSPFMRYGFTPGAGSTLIFPAKFGYKLGWEILFSAKEYKGKDLKDKSKFVQIISNKDIIDEALKLACSIAKREREELILLKAKNTEPIRLLLGKAIEQEVGMHQLTFVGNPEVKKRIHAKFDNKILSSKKDILISSLIDSDDKNITSIQDLLKNILAKELHMKSENIDEDVKFIELGLDSITGVAFTRTINDVFGLSLHSTILYDLPTIKDLSVYILNKGALPKVSSARANVTHLLTASGLIIPTKISSADISKFWKGKNEFLIHFFTEMSQTFVESINFEDFDALASLSNKPVLYVANHQTAIESMLFLLWIYLLFDKPVHYFGKIEYSQNETASPISNLYKLIFSSDGLAKDIPLTPIYINRQNPEQGLSQMKKSFEEASKEDYSLLIHSAGTRSFTSKSLTTTISLTVVNLAVNHNIPIIPVQFSGGLPDENPDLLRRDLPEKFGKQIYRIGSPILPNTLRDLSSPERAKFVLDRVNGLNGGILNEKVTAPNMQLYNRVQELMRERPISEIEAICFIISENNPILSKFSQEICSRNLY